MPSNVEIRQIQNRWRCDACDRDIAVNTHPEYTQEELDASNCIHSSVSKYVYDGSEDQETVHTSVCSTCLDDTFYYSEWYNCYQVCEVDDAHLEETLTGECTECGDRYLLEDGQCCLDEAEEEITGTDTPYCGCNGCVDARDTDKRMGVVCNWNTNVLIDCKDSEGMSVMGYGPKDTANALTLGVELEMVPLKRNDKELMHNIHHAFIKRYKARGSKRTTAVRHCLTKSDSSISPYGYELVTVPATLSYHKELWEPFFNDCASEYRTEASNRTNGMHVHIGRKGLSRLEQTKFVLFINHKDNRKLIKDIAGRDIREWANVDDKKAWDCVLEQKRISTDKYRAVNLKNESTMEVRIFNGEISKENVYKNLEFVHAVAMFCKSTANTALSTSDFYRFVRQDRRQYPYLFKFLKDLGYKVNKTKTGNIVIPRSSTSERRENIHNALSSLPDNIPNVTVLIAVGETLGKLNDAMGYGQGMADRKGNITNNYGNLLNLVRGLLINNRGVDGKFTDSYLNSLASTATGAAQARIREALYKFTSHFNRMNMYDVSRIFDRLTDYIYNIHAYSESRSSQKHMLITADTRQAALTQIDKQLQGDTR